MSIDTAGAWDDVREVLGQYDLRYDTVCFLQTTSPPSQADDIVEAYKLFGEKNSDNINGGCETDHPPLWMNTISNNLSMGKFIR